MDLKKSFDRSQIPAPIFDIEPQYIELYWKAWEFSWDHITLKPGAPQSPYMDEAFSPKNLWIWDTCFMALFCKYAPQVFPGIQSLNNFYLPLYDKVTTPLKIWHLDNPPLFAWVELEYFKLTGDLNRLRWVLIEKQYLQKHYDFIENSKRFHLKKRGSVPLFAKRTQYGYQWIGVASGMDNTPRGGKKFWQILWLDLLAQQALVAEKIIQISKILKHEQFIEEYQAKYEGIKALMNKYYWNEEDGIYYDIKKKSPTEQVKVKTPATFWPMLAGLCSKAQASQLADKIIDPQCFGGEIPLPSVSRDDPTFNPQGKYWRGSVWLPLAYMTIKALEQYGYYELADSTALNLLQHMLSTYQNFEPHTIWEAYSPTEAKPATKKRIQEIVRPDFCGWSALGPIALFIENILGFHHINALEKKIEWRLYQKKRHGIQQLRFGTIITDIVYESDQIKVSSNEPYSLSVNGKNLEIHKGKQEFEVSPK